jgi:hypothetical protein
MQEGTCSSISLNKNEKNMKPDFKSIDISNIATSQLAGAQVESTWVTPELIPVKPFYTKQDVAGMEHLQLRCWCTSLFTWTI